MEPLREPLILASEASTADLAHVGGIPKPLDQGRLMDSRIAAIASVLRRIQDTQVAHTAQSQRGPRESWRLWLSLPTNSVTFSWGKGFKRSEITPGSNVRIHHQDCNKTVCIKAAIAKQEQAGVACGLTRKLATRGLPDAHNKGMIYAKGSAVVQFQG